MNKPNRPARLANIAALPWILFVVLFLAPTARADAPKALVKGSEAYREAFKAVADHKPDDAAEALKKIDASNPAGVAERDAIGAWLDFQHCKFDSAATKLKSALQADGKQPLALLLMARFLFAGENNIEQAEATAKLAVENDGDNPVILWWAIEFVRPRNHETRLKWLEHCIELGGTSEIPRGLDSAREMLDYLKKLGGRETDKIVKGTRGELPIALRPGAGPRINVPLEDGSSMAMTFDTGCSAMIVPQSKLGAVKNEVLGKATAYAVTGPVNMDRILVDTFNFTGVEYKSVMAVSSPNSLLGMGLFKNSVLVIDFAKSRVVTHTDHDEFEKEWAAQIKSGEKLPFMFLRNSIIVPATLKCGDKETTGAALLDTGAAITALSIFFGDAWNKEAGVPLGKGGNMPVMGAGGMGRMEMKSMPGGSIHIGSTWSMQPGRMPVIDLAATRNANGIDVSAIVGIGDMSRRQFIIVDCQKREIYIGPAR